MPIPGAVAPEFNADNYAEAVSQAPVPQALHTATVFGEAAHDFTDKTLRAVPDILYRAVSDFGQGDADTAQDAARRDAESHVWTQGAQLSTDQLNERYGVDGYLRFNEPTTADDAAWRHAQASEAQFRDQVFAATRPQPLTDFGASLAGALVDPIGAPLMLGTGGLGEAALGAREAQGAVAASQAVTKLGRVANVLRQPAIGALSNLPFVAANYGLSTYVGDDYSLVDGLRDLAAGAILHTAGHYAGEGLSALARAARERNLPVDPSLADAPANVPPPPSVGAPLFVPDAVQDLPPASRAGAFAKAVDDMASDRPVDVGQYVDRELNLQSPEHLNELDASPQVQSFRPLDPGVAITARGTEVPVRFGLAELDDLTTSHTDDLQPNAAYPQELQPRDRTRAGAQANNFRLEQELNPKLLMFDQAAGAGAPVVAPDGVVESGNGRTIALRRSAAKGGEAYAKYLAELKARGIDTSGMRKPVLIRMRTEPMEGAQRAALARELNADVVERMSETEQAMADARKVPEQSLTEIPPNQGPTTSRDFARDFIASAAPDQANTLADSQGTLSPAGARRIKAAVLAHAYGDPRLVGQIFEGEEQAARQHAEGLAEAAPAWAKMRALARTGQIPAELDLTEPLRSAMDMVRFARQEGESVGRLVAERLGQTDMFSGEAISPQTEAFLRLMFRDEAMTRPESPEKIASALREYARQASEVKPGPDLFGETAGEDTARQILSNLASRFAGDERAGVDSVRPPGKSKSAVEPRPSIVDVPEPGQPGDGAGADVPAEPGRQPGADEPGAGEASEVAERASAERIINGDEELRRLADETRQATAMAGIEEPKLPANQDPDNIAKATEALSQCLIGAAEEVLS